MKSTILALFLLGSLAATASADIPPFLLQVTPPDPAAGDSIGFVLSTELPGTCWDVQGVSCGVSDTTGTISVDLIRRDEPCLLPARRVDEACGVGPLPPGHYELVGVLTGFDARGDIVTPPDTVALGFTVTSTTPVVPVTWGLLKAHY